MKGIFITGTDTGIGKTHFTIACIQALQSAGCRVAAMKPVASGAERINGRLCNEDALRIIEALDHDVDYELINPYCFRPPVSPHIAAAEVGVEIDVSKIKNRCQLLSENTDYTLVEGVGGWLAPLSDSLTVADLASALALPVIMVVAIRLGCLNHAMLTAQSINRSGLELAGWVANCVEPEADAVERQIDYLSRRLSVSPIARIGWQSPAQIELANLPGLNQEDLYIE